jgi:hypothetical protein
MRCWVKRCRGRTARTDTRGGLDEKVSDDRHLLGGGRGHGGAGVGADTGTTANLKGSDTLFDLTTAMIAACPGAVPPYAGTGSGDGESAMINGTQAIAPMSRFLGGKACAGAKGVPEAGIPAVTNGSQAEGIVIGLDGVLIVGSPPQRPPVS